MTAAYRKSPNRATPQSSKRSQVRYGSAQSRRAAAGSDYRTEAPTAALLLPNIHGSAQARASTPAST